MTFRGRGRGDDRSQARPLDPGTYDDAARPDYGIRSQPSNPRGEIPRYEPEWRRHSDNHHGGYGSSGGHGFLRFLIFAVILAALVVTTMFTVLRPVVRSAVVDWAWENPGALRIGLVADLVREDLGGQLTDPAGSSDEPIEFEVALGDTAASSPILPARATSRSSSRWRSGTRRPASLPDWPRPTSSRANAPSCSMRSRRISGPSSRPAASCSAAT